MKILHVVPTYLPAVRYGGPIFAVHGLAKALSAAGHDVHVFTTNVDGKGVTDVPLDRPVKRESVQVHYFTSPYLRRLYYSPDLRAQCIRQVTTFDLVHLHSVFLYPTFAAASVARKSRVPFVLSPRGMLVRELIDERNGMLKRAWISAVESGNLRNAAAIHLTSEEERRALTDLGLTLAPTAIIGNGVDEPASFTIAQASADVRAECRRGFDILCFGRISWKKGLDRAIRALSLMPSATLLIAGNDEDDHTKSLKAIASGCGVEDRVSFLPRQISGSDKEVLFAAAKLIALPSVSENFGNVVVEALIRGKPVVVTEGVGAAEIVTACGGGIVTTNDDAEFAAALATLLSSNEQREQMGRAGAIHVRRDYTWANVARRFEALYESVMPKQGFAVSTRIAGVA